MLSIWAVGAFLFIYWLWIAPRIYDTQRFLSYRNNDDTVPDWLSNSAASDQLTAAGLTAEESAALANWKKSIETYLQIQTIVAN